MPPTPPRQISCPWACCTIRSSAPWLSWLLGRRGAWWLLVQGNGRIIVKIDRYKVFFSWEFGMKEMEKELILEEGGELRFYRSWLVIDSIAINADDVIGLSRASVSRDCFCVMWYVFLSLLLQSTFFQGESSSSICWIDGDIRFVTVALRVNLLCSFLLTT